MIDDIRALVARPEFDVALRDLAAGLGRPFDDVRVETAGCLVEFFPVRPVVRRLHGGRRVGRLHLCGQRVQAAPLFALTHRQ
jgi:hypothetical protein